MGFPGSSVVKNHLQHRKCTLDPWVRKIPCRRRWQLTPVFLPGRSHGQRSLAGYSLCMRVCSPRVHKGISQNLATKTNNRYIHADTYNYYKTCSKLHCSVHTTRTNPCLQNTNSYIKVRQSRLSQIIS